jgi:outer membrane protein assembly factor BamB
MTNSGQTLSAKRVGPKDIAPIEFKGLRFEVIHWGKSRGFGQNGGYIAAFDRGTGKELWTLKVYDIPYDPALESDVQDVFIATLSKALFGAKLKISDENGRRYVVDIDSRTASPR